MPSSINASTTAGLVNTADTSGVLQLQTAGVTAISIDASQAVSFTNSPTVTGGTANGVAYLNGSKVLTTGSALVFDGTNLGVGTASPIRRLEVSTTSTGTLNLIGLGTTGAGGQGMLLGVDTTNSYAFIKNNTSSSYGMAFFSGNGSEAARFDSSGNLGVGTTSPTSTLSVGTLGTTSAPTITIGSSTSGSGSIYFGDGATASDKYRGYIEYVHSSDYMAFGTSATERARIDSSGNLLVGTTSTSGGFVVVKEPVYSGWYTRTNHPTGVPSGYGYADFLFNGSGIGSITQNGTTGVLYNTTSDYRLKNDQQALTGAKDFIMALKPKKWQWWNGSGEGVGFVAHEFMEVAKHSGNGEKDAVDSDGKPVYQSIQPSSSEVMANLVSFIQEQQALITQLQADVAALKGATP